jgi:hypothetical protein
MLMNIDFSVEMEALYSKMNELASIMVNGAHSILRSLLFFKTKPLHECDVITGTMEKVSAVF